MPNITIDGEQYEVESGQNLLNTCLSQGIDLPYFCWHPSMGSVGACRQCAVIEYKDADDQRGRIVMGCMTQVRDGGIYSVNAESAREFRGGIIEDLMTNHPHDCPVCEEGGECHLQDMTEMTGHTNRRYRGPKRTHRNQYLGPFINHEMNRCITCYRCTRFYRDYAGGTDLAPLGRNNQVYFGRQQPGMLQSGFSGNLVEVCPTGVFTDKTFSQHFVRKWDLQTAPSICEHCAVGCNTAPGAREPGNGQQVILRRVVNLFHRDINGYFLCDRGRFGYDYVNSSARIKRALTAVTEELIGSTAPHTERVHRELPPATAVGQLARSIAEAQKGQRRLIGVGSPRTSLENNYALRQLVGSTAFFSGLAQRDLRILQLIDRIQRDPRIHSPTVPEIERADAVLILDEDISNTAPRVALAVRQAARNRQKQQAQNLKIPLWQDASVRQLDGEPNPIIIAGSIESDLDELTCERLCAQPAAITQFAAAVAAQLQGSTLPDDDLSESQREMARRTVALLRDAQRPLVIAGCSGANMPLVQCAAQISLALAAQDGASSHLYLTCPEANSLGLTQFFQADCGHLEQLVEELQCAGSDQVPTSLIVLENDLYRRGDKSLVDDLLSRADEVVLLDSLLNETARRAELIFPAAATAESQGSYVNSNGLAQRFYAVYEGPGYIQESWRWLGDAARACGEKNTALTALAGWQHSTDLSEAIAAEFSQFDALVQLGPDEEFRIDGLRVARQSHRFSGRTALHAGVAVAEQPPHSDPDAPMAFSMEGIHSPGKTPLQANIWSPGWNSNQSIHKFQRGVDGERIAGSSGKKIQRTAQSLPDWSPSAGQEPPSADSGELTLVPLFRMFGSEELSTHAEAIASIVGAPRAVIGRTDAAAHHIHSGDRVQLEIGSRALQLEVQVSEGIADGTLGLPFGWPQLEEFCSHLPGRARITAVERTAETTGDTP